MHAFLFIGGTITQRQHAIYKRLDSDGIPSYDRLELIPNEKTSIGVTDVRSYIQHLYFNPHGNKGVAAIIPDSGLLTDQAQQALLKTIEEPPSHVQLFIGAASETNVLPTIASRCQIISLHSNEIVFSKEEIAACQTLINNISSANRGSRIKYLQSIGKTRDDAKRWIDCAIISCRESNNTLSHIHALLDAKRLSENNVNPFQLLEHIFLTT